MLNRALRLVRVYHNMSTTETAKRLGISVGYLSDLETKKKDPSLKVLRKYATAFKIPLSALLLFAEQVNSSPDEEGTRVYIGEKALRILEWIDEVTEDKDNIDKD